MSKIAIIEVKKISENSKILVGKGKNERISFTHGIPGSRI
jgi:hypothetical protein